MLHTVKIQDFVLISFSVSICTSMISFHESNDEKIVVLNSTKVIRGFVYLECMELY